MNIKTAIRGFPSSFYRYQPPSSLPTLPYAKTTYAPGLRTLYTLLLHLITPVVLILFGGTRGFGDIAIFIIVMVSLLHGLRRWMMITFGLSAIVLVYIFYRDATGQPITPLISYSSQFTSLKFLISMTVMVLITWFGNSFYRNLLAKYRKSAINLEAANVELQANSDELAHLNSDLQASRRKIVTAREEERRRLRRDLHDGLGPTLAAQILRVGIARSIIESNPTKAATMLDDLEDGIENTLTDVRRLVYALRPPLLDQLGLLGAIREHVNKLEVPFAISLDLPTTLPMLSAAVEVAAFRIVQTSLDNVAKHAQATRCSLQLQYTVNSLVLSVGDNGVGIPENNLEGVGLTSMRERAEELGGEFTLATIQPQGTHLTARLPFDNQ